MLTIPGYQITARLYESKNSLIYRARRQSDHQPVVLKLLNEEYPTPERLARFRREYEMTRKLQSENIIGVYSLEPYQNTLMIVMEDFGGDSLARLLPAHPLELAKFLPLALRIVEILGNIHQHHLIHKDIRSMGKACLPFWNMDAKY